MKKPIKRTKNQEEWFHYQPLSDSIAILNGSFSLNHKRFAYKSKGYQSPAVCLMAILFSKLEKIQVWNPDAINSILTIGDSLYLKVLLKSVSKNSTPLNLLKIIEHPIYLGEYKFAVDDNVNAIQDMLDSPETLALKLNEQKLSTLIISIKRYYFAIIRSDNYYCLFDPNDRDQNGNPCRASCGTACVLRFSTLNILCKHFCSYLRIDHPAFKIFPIRITRVSKLEPNNEEIPVDITVKSKNKKKKLQNKDKLSDTSSNTLEEFLKPILEGQYDDNNQLMEITNRYCSLVHDEKLILKKNTYFQECCLNNSKYRILRANSFNSNSLVINALIMLRHHNLQLWNSFILDNILCMIIDNLNEPVQCEDQKYLINIQTVKIIGRLRSKDPVVFNLYDGLNNFFKKNDMGILEGPLTVAIWMERGKFFMWDNNDRDDKGIKCIYDDTKELFCTACVTEYSNLDDLIMVYSKNIEENNRNDFFMIKPVSIQDYSFTNESWYNFIGLNNRPIWILRGIEQANRSSLICMEIISLISLTSLKYDDDISKFDAKTVDLILNKGTEMVKESDSLAENPVFKFKNKEAHIDFEMNILSGNISNNLSLKEALDKFFTLSDMGILETNSICFAIWKLEDHFFSYHPFSCNENGILSNAGTACILRSSNLLSLVKILASSFSATDKDFTISTIKIVFWNIDDYDGAVIPISPNFKPLVFENEIYQNGFGILLAGHCDCNEEKYNWRAGLQSIQNCYSALAMSKIYESLQWNENVLDEILKLGDELYMRLLEDNQIKNIDIDIKFKIGSNEFTLKPLLLESLDGFFINQDEQINSINEEEENITENEEGEQFQKNNIDLNNNNNDSVSKFNENRDDDDDDNDDEDYGSDDEEEEVEIIAILDEPEILEISYDLESALKKLFNKYTHLILESQFLKTALWSEDKLIYLFNPKCCDKYGNPLQNEKQNMNGKACLLLFANLNRCIQYVTNLIVNNANESFKVYPIEITTNLIMIEDVFTKSWNNFQSVTDEEYSIFWILRGCINQRDEIFQKQNRGKQSIFNCIISLCFCSFCNTSEFEASTINLILFYGDRLYTIKEKMINDNCDKTYNELQSILKVIKSFSMKNLKINCALDNYILTGDIKANDVGEILNIKTALEKFFNDQKYPPLAILEVKDEFFATWKSALKIDNQTIEYYYLFDPEPCGPDGTRSTYGKASISRHENLTTLSRLIMKNLPPEGINQFYISLLQVKITENDKFAFYNLTTSSIPEIMAIKQEKVQDVFILQGDLSQDSEVFNRTEHTACAANCITALCMHSFHKTITWTERFIDDILNFADKVLYEESRKQFDKEFDPKLYKIGLNKLIKEFKFKSHVIRFDINDDCKINGIWRRNSKPILFALYEFFSKNYKYGAFKCSLLFAIWKEELYYLFDPHAEHKINNDFHNLVKQGHACLYGFKTMKSLAEFLLITIPDSVGNGTQFEIVPISFDISYKDPNPKDIKNKLEDHEICNYKLIEAENDIYILQGTLSLYSDKYEPNLRGCQIYPVTVIGCVISILRNPRTWTSNIIDDILDIGMSLYKLSVDYSKADNLHIGFENIIRSLKTCNKISELVHSIDEIKENTIIEIFKARIQDDLNFESLLSYLNEWFISESHAIIEKKINLVLKNEFRIINDENMDETSCNYEQVFCTAVIYSSNNYYLLDPYNRDSSGNAIERGQACVIRSKSLARLLEKFFANTSSGIDHDSFNETITYSIYTTDLRNI